MRVSATAPPSAAQESVIKIALSNRQRLFIVLSDRTHMMPPFESLAEVEGMTELTEGLSSKTCRLADGSVCGSEDAEKEMAPIEGVGKEIDVPDSEPEAAERDVLPDCETDDDAPRVDDGEMDSSSGTCACISLASPRQMTDARLIRSYRYLCKLTAKAERCRTNDAPNQPPTADIGTGLPCQACSTEWISVGSRPSAIVLARRIVCLW